MKQGAKESTKRAGGNTLCICISYMVMLRDYLEDQNEIQEN